MSHSITINGKSEFFVQGETLLTIARRAGVEIPTLCHDDRVDPAGACRMCLVEVSGSRLMQPACSFKATPGLEVLTNTERVDRNRRFILSLHQADMVQNRVACEDNNPSRVHALADLYGDAGRFPPLVQSRGSRSEDSNPFIEFRSDRCILCSLCVRYCEQVESVTAITLSDRGQHTTISTVDELSLTDTTCELCGGCVDVCPTGAMTEKRALAYGKAESDLEKVRTTCNYCGVGCQLDLNVDRAANRVVKVTSPPPGSTVNDGNLCVKGRFAYDFIDHPDRLTKPLVRGADGAFHEVSWDEALDRTVQGLTGVANRHGPDSLSFVSSSRCTGEENYLFQKMARAAFGTHNIHQCAAT